MLRCNEQSAVISSLNPRAERHGEDPVPASDIGISFETSSKVLDSFHKGMREAFYTDEAPKGAQQTLPGTADLPYLKFNGTLGALKIKKEWPGYRARIQWGEVSNTVDVDLADVKVTKITAEPKEGGTCLVNLQLQAHPDKVGVGELSALIQREVRLTLTPPSAAELKALQKREAEAKKKDGDDDEGNE